jgi:phosphatidylglycerophosphate synthase
MDPREEKIYNLRIKVTEAIFRPIIKFFTVLHVTADMLSYLGVLVMLGFIWALPENLTLAFWLLVARVFIDVMDGPLARYQKTDSDRGKFVDVLMDNLSFALFIFGVIGSGLMQGVTGAIYLFLTELVIVLMIIRYNFKHKDSDWLFFASAGSFPYNFIYATYLTFAIYAFGGSNYLTDAAQIFSIFLGFKALKDYWAIQKTKKS